MFDKTIRELPGAGRKQIAIKKIHFSKENECV